jgi:hypothetical protein
MTASHQKTLSYYGFTACRRAYAMALCNYDAKVMATELGVVNASAKAMARAGEALAEVSDAMATDKADENGEAIR